MSSVLSFVMRRPVLIYFLLTFAITWGSILMVFSPSGMPPSDEQFERLAPFAYMAMLAGPRISGLVMIGLVSGRAGFRELLSRLSTWRVSARWYSMALLIAPLSLSSVFLTLSVLSPEFSRDAFVPDNLIALLLTGIVVGLAVGLFEEIGWTGFAIPRLRLRYGIVITGFTVGILWGAWHFPVWWADDSFSGVLPVAVLLGGLFAWMPAFRVMMVWVYDRSGSLLVAVLMHASLLASQLYLVVPLELSARHTLMHIAVWAGVLWLLVAVVLLVNRWQLRQSGAPTMTPDKMKQAPQ
jgi:uncharacterized protein